MAQAHGLSSPLHPRASDCVVCRWYYRPQELELSNGLTAEDREVFRSDERGIHPINSGAKPIRCVSAAFEHHNSSITMCNKHSWVAAEAQDAGGLMPFVLCSWAVAGRAEVLSPSSFWLRSAADANLTDVWMCYRHYDTVTHDIRTLSASEGTAAG